MAGVAYTLVLESPEAQAALARLSPGLLAQIGDEVGALVADQTTRRIDAEKTAPDGTPWAPWSPRYAARIARRKGVSGRSLLVGEGNLLGSIQNYVSGPDIVVGTNIEYGAIHQFGGDPGAEGGGIPARPYLGVSIENAAEIEDLVLVRLDEVLQ